MITDHNNIMPEDVGAHYIQEYITRGLNFFLNLLFLFSSALRFLSIQRIQLDKQTAELSSSIIWPTNMDDPIIINIHVIVFMCLLKFIHCITWFCFYI